MLGGGEGEGEGVSLEAGALERGTLPEPGLPVDYCVFCYHGTGFLRADNTALLTKFISERGSILPRRFTKCCSKHQRKCVCASAR